MKNRIRNAEGTERWIELGAFTDYEKYTQRLLAANLCVRTFVNDACMCFLHECSHGRTVALLLDAGFPRRFNYKRCMMIVSSQQSKGSCTTCQNGGLQIIPIGWTLTNFDVITPCTGLLLKHARAQILRLLEFCNQFGIHECQQKYNIVRPLIRPNNCEQLSNLHLRWRIFHEGLG